MPYVQGIVVHATRSGRARNPTEGSGTLGYVQQYGTTSYNDLIDLDGTLYALTDEAAWHAEELNRTWWGIALAQGTEGDPISSDQHRTLAWRIRSLCVRYEIPLHRVLYLASPKAGEGITQHMDTAQGRRWGKNDVGFQLDWEALGL